MKGTKYGLKLNQNKCEAMSVRGRVEIKFQNGGIVKEMKESKYLGCYLNNKTDVRREINRRKSDVFVTWKRLEELWKHTDCDNKFKVIAYDAVVRAKLMYGLETLQVNKTERDDQSTSTT